MSDQRTTPGHVDSLGKMMSRIALVAKEQVIYNGKPIRADRDTGSYTVLPPDEIYLSPSLLREFNCATGCTACCLPFTLDFTNDEFGSFEWAEDVDAQADAEFDLRLVNVNGETVQIQSYPQYKDPSCPYLRPTREGGALGCGFWSGGNSTQPLECAAAPQLLMTTRGEGTTVLMKRPFGRGWAWKNKPQCEFEPTITDFRNIDEQFDLADEIQLLQRYNHWAEYCGIETYLPEIIEVMPDFPRLCKEEKGRMVKVV